MSTHTTIFGAALGGAPDATAAATAAGTPSNAQILAAAQQAYGASQTAVDASVTALVASVQDDTLAGARTAIDLATWDTTGPPATIADPFFDSDDVTTAMAAAATGGMATYSVGVFASELPAETRGMAAITRPVGGGDAVTIELQIDIWNHVVSVQQGQNLQYGIWRKPGAALADQIYGLYATTTYDGVAVNLKVVLDESLAPYGFVVSTGATVELPVSAAVFGGSTMVWGQS